MNMKQIVCAAAFCMMGALSACSAFTPKSLTPTGSFYSPAGNWAYLGLNAQGAKEYKRPQDGAVMALVPGGNFSNRDYVRDPLDEQTAVEHNVDAFLMDKTEVTNAQVAAFLKTQAGLTLKDGVLCAPDGVPFACAHPWGLNIKSESDIAPQGGFEGYPAIGVSGFLARAYAQWVGGDLPSGYEWEKAAAGTDAREYPWGNEPPDGTRLNYFLTGPHRTMPAGFYPAGTSAYGLLDMAGNVYERAYWFENPEQFDPTAEPTMIKGGSWLSPHFANIRCCDHCGQAMQALDGSVGFRIIIRDKAVVAMLEKLAARDPGCRAPEFVAASAVPLSAPDLNAPTLRIVDDVEAAFDEAGKRNVPVFLCLVFETCGACDRTRTQIFSDPRFIEYCNENVVVLVGHDPGDGRQMPVPSGPRGESLLYPGYQTEKLQTVFDYFERFIDVKVVPEEVTYFRMSPGMFALNPYRDLIEAPEQLVLVKEKEFPKGGFNVTPFIENLKRAQTMLGVGQSRADFLAGKPAHETSWKPPENQ